MPVLSSGLTLLNNQVNPFVKDPTPGAGGGTQTLNNQPLFTTTAVAGAVNSLYGLYNVFANGGSTLQKVTAGAGALVAVNNAANAIVRQATGDLALQASTTLNTAATAVGKYLPYLSIANSLAQGDYKGAAVAVASIAYPGVGWAYAAYTLVSSILHDEPDAWGRAEFKFGGSTQLTLDTTGYGIGKGKVDLLMQGNGLSVTDPNYFGGLLGYLSDQVAQAAHFSPDTPLGIIPQRLPTLSWHQATDSQAGYMLTDVDPITGEARYPTLRYDDNFKVLNGDPLDPAQRMDLFSRLVMSALARDAIAPMWEVQTARLQQDLGDPDAGLTEEQRAARHGWTAAAGPDGKRLAGKFLPVVLDLDGDGKIATVGKDASGVSFNWDDSGFLKDTAWVKATDGFLVLDRNLNGVADGGKDLFSNSNVADDAKGLRSMRWADANADSVIDANDPVFAALRVWRDLNQDGLQDKDETKTLAELGITSIDYGNGRYTMNGNQFAIKSQELEADNDGMTVSLVKGGLQVNYANGKSTLYVSEVLDADGVDGAGSDFLLRNDKVVSWEDGVSDTDAGTGKPRRQTEKDHQSITIAASLLLANDAIVGDNTMTITGVSGAEHGTVSFNAEQQTIEFLPEHNFYGLAKFTYTVTDKDGRTRTATVDVDLKPVIDEPTVDVQLDKLAVYGYAAKATQVEVGDDKHTVVELASDEGQVMYSPYTTVLGRRVHDNGDGSVSYDPASDTGISVARFQANYDAVSHMYAGLSDGPIRSIRMKIDGVMFEIDAEPGVLVHDTPIKIEDGNDGVIQVLSPDNPGARYRFEIFSDGTYGHATIDPDTGRFTYTGKRWMENDFDGNVVGHDVDTDDHAHYDPHLTDNFTVKIIDLSDQTGNTFSTKDVQVTHYGELPHGDVASGGGGKLPIAIDLDGDGFHFKDVDDSNVFFDINGDGWRRRMAWVDGNDGFIAYDKNGDGKITEHDELSFVSYKSGSQTDLEGLAGFDSNHDGKFSAADEKWASFGVWQDANENGITDAGEFRSLDSMGITEVSLDSDGHFQIINGQTVNGFGSAKRADGGSYTLADVALRYKNVTQGKTDDGTVVTAPIAPFSTGQVFNGTDGADLVFGTAGSDQYHLGAGDDVVSDGDGDDAVEAGDGDDIVMTGAGNDFVDAGNGADKVFAGDGDDVVLAGAGDDFVSAGDGNDIVFGGEGQDMISGGNGNDLLSGDQGDDQIFGESGRDVLFGGDGDDQLFGGDGDDQLDGGNGNDILDGGAGVDVMIGGAGHDRYAVDNAGDLVVEQENGGYDTVVVDKLSDYTLGANVEALQLGKDASNGTGNALDNALYGNEGNNRLDGREGADKMAGGAGDDTYLVDNAGDQVIEYANQGNDSVIASVNYTLGANVENLTLTAGAVQGTGNLQDNVITGNDQDNVLIGGGGRDTLIGGRGDDRYIVDSADDLVIEQDGEGIDTVESFASYVLGANVENLTLVGTGNLDATGNGLSNTLTGTVGNNRLDGGAGADTLIGGAGDDIYLVDNDGDLVVERAGEGADLVVSSVDYQLGDNVENLALTGQATRGSGNALDNRIIGNDRDNHLDGGSGRDTLIGGLGNDTYVIDSVDDVIVEEAGEGVDTVESSVDYVLGAELENLTLTVGAATRATGNELDNVLIGNDNDNVLDGAAGHDTLIGGRGDDQYFVDGSDDVVVEKAGEGTDTVNATASYVLSANVENLRLKGEADLDGTGNVLDNTIVGNSGSNRLDGGAGRDLLIGGAGDDTYVVDDAGDRVVELAGEGVDTVYSSADFVLGDNLENLRLVLGAHLGVGNSEANVIEGLAQDGVYHGIDGIASLRGEGGNDTLITHQGHDHMVGGTGDDLYVIDTLGFDGSITEEAGEGIDTVRSYANIELGANVENLTLLGYADRGVGNELDNIITAAERGGSLFGGGGSDTLIGGAGNDLLDGGSGADVMSGGGGDDQYVVDDAGDVVIEEAGGHSPVQDVIDGVKHGWEWLPGFAGVVDAVVDYVRGHQGQTIVWDDLVSTLQQQGVGDDWTLILYPQVFQPLLELDFSQVGGSGGGNDTVTAFIDYTLGANVENLSLGGAANLSGTGNALDNTLIGNDGANRLDGGEGADLMVGGLGDDVYVVDNAGDMVVEADASDHPWTAQLRQISRELKQMAGSDGWADRVDPALAQIDALLTDAAANGVTDITAVNLFGVIQDMVSSEAQLAVKVRNLLWDRVTLTGSGSAVDGGHDLVLAAINYVAASGVEDVTLIGTAGSATGNALNNMLTGNALDNVLSGGAGNDHLIGGAGNDTLIGGSGDDVFDWHIGDGMDSISDESGHDALSFGAGVTANSFDYVTEMVDGQPVTTLLLLDAQGHPSGEGVRLNGSAATGFEIEELLFADGSTRSVKDLLAAIDAGKQPAGEDYYGTAGDDIFYLRDAKTGVINRYHGGAGRDSIMGDWADQRLLLASDMSNIDSIEVIDSLDNFRSNAIVGTDGSDHWDFSGITVKHFVIAPGDGDDEVIGTNGDDVIKGGKGADRLFGGAGNDSFLLVSGDDDIDQFDGGSGTNDIFATWGVSTLRVTSTADNLVNIQRIESLDFAAGAFSIVSTSGDDNLDFSGMTLVNVQIDAGTGNDVVVGSASDDRIRGGAGADVLSGGAGDDTFVLTASDTDIDRFDGGTGSNKLYGGWGVHELRVTSNMDNLVNIQRIESEEYYEHGFRVVSTGGDDHLNFSAMSLKNVEIDAGAGDDVVIGSAGNDRIHGGAGVDHLFGGAGDDEYLWGTGDGNDHITDDAGNNTIVFGWDVAASDLSVATTEGAWQLQVHTGGGQPALLTIDRFQNSSMHVYVRLGDATYAMEDLPVGNLITPWDAASSASAMTASAGWSSMESQDAQAQDSDRVNNGLIGAAIQRRVAML